MTRINIGIPVEDLCDTHLLAEYRELPRMHSTAWSRWTRFQSTGPRPTRPTLGKGHVLFFLPFGMYLHRRFCALCDELVFRGRSPTLDWRRYPEAWTSGDVPLDLQEAGGVLLRARIRERLATMRRPPVWTRRDVPAWCAEVVRHRSHT